MFEHIIPAIIGLVSGGGLVGLFTIKQTKASKDLDNAVRLVAEYRELLSEYKAEIDANRQETDELKQKYEDCRAELIEIKAQLTMAQTMYRQADLLRCEKLQCLQRKPPIDEATLHELSGITVKDNNNA